LYKRRNLPGETQNYVPEILAAIIIANHPTQYGFDDITLDPPVLTDTMTINYAVDLRLVSDLVNAPVDELMALNPSLLRMATPPDATFDLQRIAGIPESKRTSWRYHRVTADDTLASVARTYHVTVSDLADANQMREDQSVSGMEALVVPVAPVATPSLRTLMYTTRRGDTLVSIADRFGVSLNQLRRWNKISSGIKVEPGRRLHVGEPSSTQRSSARSRRGSSSTPSTKRGALAKNGRGSKAGAGHAQGSTRAATKPSSQATKRRTRQKLYAERQK
jgi:membrane-bound lytic murein transglycosylase D